MALLLFHGENYSIHAEIVLSNLYCSCIDIALKFRTKASIIFCKKSTVIVLTLNFWFCLKMGTRTFKN